MTGVSFTSALHNLESAARMFERSTFRFAPGRGRAPSVTALKTAATQALDAVEILKRDKKFKLFVQDSKIEMELAEVQRAQTVDTVANATWASRDALLGWGVLKGTATEATVIARAQELLSRKPATLNPHEWGELMAFSGDYDYPFSPRFANVGAGSLDVHIFGLVGITNKATRKFDSFSNFAKDWMKRNDPKLTPERIRQEAVELFGTLGTRITKKPLQRLKWLLFTAPAGREAAGPRECAGIKLEYILETPARAQEPSNRQWLRAFGEVWATTGDPAGRRHYVQQLRSIGRGEHPETFHDRRILQLALSQVHKQVLNGLDKRAKLETAARLLTYAPDRETLGYLARTIDRLLPERRPNALQTRLATILSASDHGLQSPLPDIVSWMVLHPRNTQALRERTIRSAAEVAARPSKTWTPTEHATLRAAAFGMPEPDGTHLNQTDPFLEYIRSVRHFDNTDRTLREVNDRFARAWTRIVATELPSTQDELIAAVMTVFRRDPATWTSNDLESVHDLLASTVNLPGKLPSELGDRFNLQSDLENIEQYDGSLEPVIRSAKMWNAQIDPTVREQYGNELRALADAEAGSVELAELATLPAMERPIHKLIGEVRGVQRARRALALASGVAGQKDVTLDPDAKRVVDYGLRITQSALRSGTPETAGMRKVVSNLAAQNLRRIHGTLDDGYESYPNYSELGEMKAMLQMLAEFEHPSASVPPPFSEVVTW
jgi:hypothetical protein